jgi:hypothetical protein
MLVIDTKSVVYQRVELENLTSGMFESSVTMEEVDVEGRKKTSA